MTALTFTASYAVYDTAVAVLGMHNPLIFAAPPNETNLYFQIIRKKELLDIPRDLAVQVYKIAKDDLLQDVISPEYLSNNYVGFQADSILFMCMQIIMRMYIIYIPYIPYDYQRPLLLLLQALPGEQEAPS